MSSSKKAVMLARLFGSYIRISLDGEGQYLISIPSVCKKPKPELSQVLVGRGTDFESVCKKPKPELRQVLVGRGTDYESACEDFLKEANGLLISEDPRKEIVVFVL
mgnify:CR=1 FL=1